MDRIGGLLSERGWTEEGGPAPLVPFGNFGLVALVILAAGLATVTLLIFTGYEVSKWLFVPS